MQVFRVRSFYVLLAASLSIAACGRWYDASRFQKLPESFTQAPVLDADGSLPTMFVSEEEDGHLAIAGQAIVRFQSGKPEESAKRLNLQLTQYLEAVDAYLVQSKELDRPETTYPFLKTLRADPDVRSAELDYIATPSLFPNDPMIDRQWALARAQLPAAWSLTTGANNPLTIAVIDTGIDKAHPDFQKRLVPGWDFVQGDDDPDDENGHGTHVAGILAATGNNKTGIAGVSWGSKLMPLKVLDKRGRGSYSAIAAAIAWAADHKAKVINLSLGGSADSPTLRSAVLYAIQKDVAVVAAMGNNGGYIVRYPAAIPGVIAVGSTTSTDEHSKFSNFGQWISVSAPGSSIYSTFPTYPVTLSPDGRLKNYAVLSGTSMATPYVAGLAALIRAKYPQENLKEVRDRLEESADDLGTKGFDGYFGYGRINAYRALR